MKKILNYIFMAGVAIACMTSCSDMLDTKSESYVFDNDHSLDSANDSVYSVMGILTQLQKLGERYVAFGELRGDLVSVPVTAPVAYQALSNFDACDEEAEFGPKRDFYSVINNCNIALARMDASIAEHGVQVMLPEYAAIHAIRDWTFLQLGLIYGAASYTEEPVLDAESAEREITPVGLDELVVKLISDIEPYAAVRTPDYGSIDGLSSRLFFIKPALLLADLYLYNGNYEQAAAMYYKVIKDERFCVSYENANLWTSSVRGESVIAHNKTYTTEAAVLIPYASDAKKYHPDMVNLTYNDSPGMVPARWFVNDMNAAQHFHIDRLGITNISGYLEGDLRGMLINRDGITQESSFGDVTTGMSSNECLVTKWMLNGTLYPSVTNPDNHLMEDGAILTRSVALYRIPHIYLRYAEAVNRAGKPSLAFAVLKYGLRGEILDDDTKVNPDELSDKVEWTDFSDPMFDQNYGTAMRGRGLGIAVEQAVYVIPADASREETVEWVEERILEEMAAETCFEGNRFFDLMRISRHRGNHPQFMAKQIGRRFDDPAQIESKLSDINNLWVR